MLLREEALSGALLAVCAVVAVLWATFAPHNYQSFVNQPVHVPGVPRDVISTLSSLASNFFLVIFFGAIGLEIGRERANGVLSENKTALLPCGAAIGGMAGAALTFLALSGMFGSHGAPSGWGIPMATDVAFTLGVLALVGRSIPSSLRVFLLALAVADDVASVFVLALVGHHSTSLSILQRCCLIAASLLVLLLAAAARKRAPFLSIFILLTLLLWWLLAQLAIEPTLAGVAIGLMVPTSRAKANPALRLEKVVAPLSTFLVLPFFALIATGVDLSAHPWSGNVGIVLPLVGARLVGKMIGILGVSWLLIRLGLGTLPEQSTWRHLFGASILCGIGFTVPLLFAEQAFGHDPLQLAATKFALLVASLLCAVVGLVILWRAPRATPHGSTVTQGR